MAASSAEKSRREELRAGSIFQYLGLQEKFIKRRMVGRKGVPRKGTKVNVMEGLVYQLLDEDKQDKTQLMIKK